MYVCMSMKNNNLLLTTCYFSATHFGDGTYFARDANYSNQDKYARPDSTGMKTMILADVITGDFCQGERNMKTPKLKPGSNHVCESAVENLSDPSIFVVFQDASAYPAYVISYK